MAKKNSWDKLTPRQRQQRAQRLAQNPSTRASVPDAYLRGFAGADKLRAERAKNTRLNAPVTPGSGMSVRDLIREAQAQTTVKYGPAQRALEQQKQQSSATQQQIPQWFQEYRDAVSGAQTQTQQAYGQANQQLVALQGQTAQHQGQEQLTQLQSDAANRGASVDPKLAQQAAQAAQVRQAMIGSQGGALAAQGAAQQGYLTNTGLASRKGQAEQMLRELATFGKLQDEERGLAGEMGAYNVAARQDIGDREQKSALERMVIAAETQQKNEALDLDKQQEATKRFDLVQDRKLARKRESRQGRTERERLANEKERIRIAREKAAKTPKTPTGKNGEKLGKPLQEPASSLSARRRIEEIRRDVAQRGFKSREEAKAYYQKNAPHLFKGNEELMLSAALDRKFLPGGKLSKGNIRALRDLGVFVTSDGAYWRGGNRGS